MDRRLMDGRSPPPPPGGGVVDGSYCELMRLFGSDINCLDRYVNDVISTDAMMSLSSA